MCEIREVTNGISTVWYFNSVTNPTRFNSIPNDKILDLSKSKSFADDIINITEMIISISDSVENIVGKEENAGYQHFLFFPRFQKPSLSGSLKFGFVW